MTCKGRNMIVITASNQHKFQYRVIITGSLVIIGMLGILGQQESFAIDPHGITVDSLGNIFTSARQDLIQKYDSNGTIVTSWSETGSESGQLDDAHGMAVDPSDNIYVVDTNNFRVQKFSDEGELITTVGSEGSGDGQFLHPHDVAVDKTSGNIYVGDYHIPNIQKFDSSGKFILKWGSEGLENGQFRVQELNSEGPEGIGVDPSGNVFVADSGNKRVQKFDSSGKFIKSWGSLGDGEGNFRYPSGLAVDPSGNVFVSDERTKLIQKFDNDGNFITSWGSEEIFDHIHYIEVDSQGFVYVANTDGENIKKFDNDGKLISEFSTAGNEDDSEENGNEN
jgi:tripartite motif-containing protein 71